MSDIEIKNFKITGVYQKNRDVITFTRVKRGLKKEDCLDQIYKELGSKHRVKRDKIKVTSIQVITDDDLEDPVLKSLANGKNVRIVRKD